jgi:hypothetical protein
MKWMGLMICCGVAVKRMESECEEDDGAECEDLYIDTDW